MCPISAYLGRVAHDGALGVDPGGVLAALRGKARDRGIAALYGHMGVPGMHSGLHVGDGWQRVREMTRAGNGNRRKGCERSRFVLGQSAERYPGPTAPTFKPKGNPKERSLQNRNNSGTPPPELFCLLPQDFSVKYGILEIWKIMRSAEDLSARDG